MNVSYACPQCRQPARVEVSSAAPTSSLNCQCGWTRPVSAADRETDPPEHCLVCDCHDLWRQKDFPQSLGLTFVALGAILSTIAWAYYMPVTAIGILLAFALADLILYTVMSDVLVCYRCGARYRKTEQTAKGRAFDLETAERYRQESLRLQQAGVLSPKS